MYEYKNFTCCFTGHRKIPTEKYQEIFNKTLQTTKTLVKKGYSYFLTGGTFYTIEYAKKKKVNYLNINN